MRGGYWGRRNYSWVIQVENIAQIYFQYIKIWLMVIVSAGMKTGGQTDQLHTLAIWIGYRKHQNNIELTPFMSMLGNRRTIYLIEDSSVLSDKNPGFDFASPHAWNKHSTICNSTIFTTVVSPQLISNKLTSVHTFFKQFY